MRRLPLAVRIIAGAAVAVFALAFVVAASLGVGWGLWRRRRHRPAGQWPGRGYVHVTLSAPEARALARAADLSRLALAGVYAGSERTAPHTLADAHLSLIAACERAGVAIEATLG